MTRPTSIEQVALLRISQNDATVALVPHFAAFRAELEQWLHLTQPAGTLDLANKAQALSSAETAKNSLRWLANPDVETLRVEWVTTSRPTGFLQRIMDMKGDREDAEAFIELLDAGKVRTAEKVNGIWEPQPHAIKGILNYIMTQPICIMERGGWDKVPLKTTDYSAADFENMGVRYVPGAVVRKGAYIGPGTVVMSHALINLGAYIAGEGVMVDAAARVASAAQVGKGVKLGAGTGIEGVLEPAGRMPTILEDHVKVGAMCEVAGIMEEGSVLASGVVMASGKRIYDEGTGQMIPPKEMVVEGQTYLLPVIPAYRLAVGGSLLNDDKRSSTDAIILKPGDLRERDTLSRFARQGLLYS